MTYDLADSVSPEPPTTGGALSLPRLIDPARFFNRGYLLLVVQEKMGNYQDAEAQPPDDDVVATEDDADPTNPLVAGALSAVYGRQVLVVTRRQYERRKISEPLFQRAEILDTHKIAQVVYKPARGKIGNVFGESGTRINVSLKTPSGRQIPLTIGSDSYVEELKYVLEKKEEIPIDYSRVVLVYGGKTMVEGERITHYGVRISVKLNVTLARANLSAACP